MSSPPSLIRHQRKRRHGMDAPADLDCTHPDDPFTNGDRSEKRARRRGLGDGDETLHPNEEGRKVAVDSEGQNGHFAQARTPSSHERPRPHGPIIVQTRTNPTTGHAANSVRRESASASRVSSIILRGVGPNDGQRNSTRHPPSSPSENSSPPPAEADSNDRRDGVANYDRRLDDFLHHDSSLPFDPNARRNRIKAMMLVYFLTYALALFVSSAVFYALDFRRELLALQRHSTIQKYETLLEQRSGSIRRFRERVRTLERRLTLSRRADARRNREMAERKREHDRQMEKYEAIFNQHDYELNEALDRIEVLRGHRPDESTALDAAGLRTEESTEENDRSSHHSNEAEKHPPFAARVTELIHTVESLTQQLRAVGKEKDDLTVVCAESNDALARVASEYEQLEFLHRQTTDLFLAPLLSHVRDLLLASDRQKAVILELTSLVGSLRSSSELDRSNSQIRLLESHRAVNAVAVAAGEIASQQARRCETERASYAELMERRLTRTEEEALGAVVAVAEAAGKLEYERKAEEEARWRSYVREVETTLGGIGEMTERDAMDALSRRASSEEWNDDEDAWERERDGADDEEGRMETSVLRAAISRRMEEGIASLRKYVYPYNYLREKRDLYPWESISDE
ncbi:hypothetical protein ACHAW6_007581 [Cyclotella cf. meneghiniana]